MDISPQDELLARANELYWTSDASVNRIAEELDLSKSTLYAMIESKPSGLLCPRCGSEMLYPNRTARQKGFLVCSGCEFEEEETALRLGGGGAEEMAREIHLPELRRPDRVLLGTVLLGAAAGVALALWARRR